VKIYLASPFFTPEQVSLVARLEGLLRSFPQFDVYSPREDGVLISMSLEDKKKNAKKIFENNVHQIRMADLIFAIVDGRDQGVTWEIAYAFANHKTIVTYTDHDYGVNVMIQECVDAHVKGMDRARDILGKMAREDDFSFDEFRDFNEGAVT